MKIQITGSEFVKQMSLLGYELDSKQNPYDDYFYLILSMAQKIDHLEKLLNQTTPELLTIKQK